MNSQFTEKLYLRFPEMFAGRNKPLTESLMAFGFDCGDGWFHVVWDLCEALETIAKEEGVPVPEAVQVKEKFGGLRFYVNRATERMRVRIKEAEQVSVHTCEVCGSPGSQQQVRGWVSTRCPEHLQAKR